VPRRASSVGPGTRDLPLVARDRLAMAHANLGHALAAKGDAVMAAQSYRRALALNPDPAVAEETLEALQKLNARDDEDQDRG